MIFGRRVSGPIGQNGQVLAPTNGQTDLVSQFQPLVMELAPESQFRPTAPAPTPTPEPAPTPVPVPTDMQVAPSPAAFVPREPTGWDKAAPWVLGGLGLVAVGLLATALFRKRGS
jgi:hypothetical protein